MSEDKELDEAWEWLQRPLDSEFWERAGKYTDKDEIRKRFMEIPQYYRSLASVMINLSIILVKNGDGFKSENSCLRFRCAMFELYKKLEDDGIDLPLPYSWFCDGVMIKPEDIVRMTNGIIGWVCDSSKEHCGMNYGTDDGMFCRFRD